MEREFKDSGIEWIGKIPKEWKVSAAKHLMSLHAGATPKSDREELWDGNIPWVTPADYKTEDVYVSKGRRNISKTGLLSCATTLLPINSIIFSKRAPIGLVALNNVPLCTNQGCIGCVPYEQKADSKYYYYVLSAFTEQFELYGSGTTFKEISANNFANFIVTVPPLPEQLRIADFLDKKCSEIDELIALQEQMIAKLTDYKQSVITEAVTKGLNPNAQLVPSGIDWIGDVPEGWKVCKLKFLCNYIKDGTHFSPNTIADGYPYITATDVRGVGIDYANAKKVSKEVFLELQKAGCQPHNGDILLVKDGATTGRVGMMIDDTECVLLSSVAMLSPNKRMTNKYLMYVLMSDFMQSQMKLSMAGAALPRITLTKLMNFNCLFSPLSEQSAIVAYLDEKCSEIDSLISLKQQKIETLKDYKKSVIYEAVTGKTVIGGARADLQSDRCEYKDF